MTPYHYTALGLNIASEFPCPELWPGDEDTGYSNKVWDGTAGPEKSRCEGGLYQAKSREFLMRIDDIAGSMVSDGKEIIIDRQTGSRDDDIRVFFVQFCYGRSFTPA
jgi:hypothetical protein